MTPVFEGQHKPNRSVTVVVGGQYGSEAKGKIVDWLAKETMHAVRTGGPNAGHTVLTDDGLELKLQQIPATVLNPDCRLYIGAGGYIDPVILAREVAETDCRERLIVDPLSGIIEPRHAQDPETIERMGRIGGVGKGGGAAMLDRVDRVDADHDGDDFKLARDYFGDLYHQDDVSRLISEAGARGESILLEGTQGFGLSLLHGPYPYTTHRDTTAAAFCSEAGISPLAVKEIILVVRTYPIRVAGNSGPLKNEISWEELSRRVGKPVLERTTVTKKVRRVAEFDLELVERACLVNQPTQIALTFLDYLVPEDEGKSDWDALSQPAREHVLELEQQLGVAVTLVSTGPKHSQTIDRRARPA
jgi:adenylosuccinate synthase